MNPKIFVLTGQTINSEAVIDALSRVKKQEDDPAYAFGIVAAHKDNLVDILQDSAVVAGIIPGSDSSQNIRDQIRKTGLEALRAFVKNDGGALAGFCAGGYLMSSKINYGACFPLKHQRSSDDNLGLIDATSYGPLSHLVLDYAFKHPEKPYISLAQVQTKHHEKLSIAYWHGGIALLPEDQNELRPLATFPEPLLINTHDDICAKIAPIAIGVKDFPQGGKAIVSAVHPEVFGDYLEPYTRHMALQKENSHYRALQEPYRATAEILKENREGLYCLFKDIVDELLDCGKARCFNGLQANKTLETPVLTR